MDDKTLEALRGSIAKWEGIVAGTMQDRGNLNCPLCQLFNPHPRPKEMSRNDCCRGCPVSDATGKQFCDGTPYEDYEGLSCDPDHEWSDYDTEKRAALGELDFLKSLLPDAASLTNGKSEP